MTTEPRRLLVGVCAVAGLGLGAPRPALAQGTTPQVFFACYVPRSGIVYRVKEPGLPQRCHGASHVEFSWVAVAGQRCPSGQVVVGFSTNGSLICAVAGEEQPPPPSPGPFAGTWSLDPDIEARCDGSTSSSLLPTFAVTYRVTTVTTSVPADGVLRFVLALQQTYDFGVLGGLAGPEVPLTVDLGLTPATGVFAGSGSVIGPFSPIGSGITITGTLAGSATVTGQFLNADAFTATTTLEMNATGVGRIEINGVPGSAFDVQFSCSRTTFTTEGNRN